MREGAERAQRRHQAHCCDDNKGCHVFLSGEKMSLKATPNPPDDIVTLAVTSDRAGPDGGAGLSTMAKPGSSGADVMAFAVRDLDDMDHSASLLSGRMSGMTKPYAFTRDLVSQLKTGLGTRLDWTAIDVLYAESKSSRCQIRPSSMSFRCAFR
jgi:hypothetical protein